RRTKNIAPHPPFPDDRERRPANLGRLGAVRPIVNGRQCQKPPSLRTILRSFGRSPYQTGIKISTKRDRHGEPPSFAMLNQTDADSGILTRVMASGIWYYSYLQIARSK